MIRQQRFRWCGLEATGRRQVTTKEEIGGPTKSSAGICMALAAKPKEPNPVWAVREAPVKSAR